MKQCKYCNGTVYFLPNFKKKAEKLELTGEPLGVYTMLRPLVALDTCYYHMKKRFGLFGNKWEKEVKTNERSF